MNEGAQQETKPCPLCIGATVTWGNVDEFWLCHTHMNAMFKKFRVDALERGRTPQIEGE